eukprot:6466604-Amphidinium_carterae.1
MDALPLDNYCAPSLETRGDQASLSFSVVLAGSPQALLSTSLAQNAGLSKQSTSNTRSILADKVFYTQLCVENTWSTQMSICLAGAGVQAYAALQRIKSHTDTHYRMLSTTVLVAWRPAMATTCTTPRQIHDISCTHHRHNTTARADNCSGFPHLIIMAALCVVKGYSFRTLPSALLLLVNPRIPACPSPRHWTHHVETRCPPELEHSTPRIILSDW